MEQFNRLAMKARSRLLNPDWDPHLAISGTDDLEVAIPVEPPLLRDQAAESLGYLSDDRSRDVLIRNLSEQNADIVFSSVFALRTVGKPEHIRRLAELARSCSLLKSEDNQFPKKRGKRLSRYKSAS